MQSKNAKEAQLPLKCNKKKLFRYTQLSILLLDEKYGKILLSLG